MGNTASRKKFSFRDAFLARISGNMQKTRESDRFIRMDICSHCPNLIYPSWNCKKCGCFMREKIKHEQSECPVGKW
jgi:hypothetical protein